MIKLGGDTEVGGADFVGAMMVNHAWGFTGVGKVGADIIGEVSINVVDFDITSPIFIVVEVGDKDVRSYTEILGKKALVYVTGDFSIEHRTRFN